MQNVNQRIDRISKNQTNEQGIINVKTFDGRIKPIEVNSQAIKLNGKNATLVIIRDLSAIVEAHQKVKSNETLFKTIFEASTNAVILTQIEDSQIIEVNQSLIELSGFSKNELIGKTTKEMGFWTSEGDRLKIINEVQQLGKADHLELQFRVKSGNFIITKVNIRRVEIFNKKYFLTIIEDITEVKKLDNEKNKLLNKLQESQRIAKIGNWTLDIKANILEWSEELYEIFEIDKSLFAIEDCLSTKCVA